MLLTQNVRRYGIAVLFISISLMATVCSSSPMHERVHRDDGKDNCDGPGNHHQAFCYGLRGEVDERETDAQRCLDKLYQSHKYNREVSHLSVTEGRCRCTVKTIFKRKWEETFKKARANLYQQCCGFTYNAMGRYEGDMRLLAMCN